MPPAGLKLYYPVAPFTYPITQRFGENPQWYPLTKGHNGIDFGIPLRTPIYATLPGKVVRVAPDSTGYGNHIRIQHDNNLLSLYGHLDEKNYALVKEGDLVLAGQQIGWSGNTGRSTGPHLHYEVRENGKAFDPERYLTTTRPDGKKPKPPAPLFKVRIKDSVELGLNVRSGPGTLYPIVGNLKAGEKVEVIGIDGATIWLQTAKGFIALRYEGNDFVEILTK